MSPLELEYVRTCTQSHARDLEKAVRVIRYEDVANEVIIQLLDKVGRGIDMMYLTLEAQVTTQVTAAATTTSNLKVKDND
tara:strand:+ start:2781 stop:3020 length:240 start_codon:yes stop_codon:yes gene_type:complete